LDCLRAIANEAAALQLEHPERANELGLLGRPEIATVCQDDLGDRQRITEVGLAWAAAMALAMRAPRRDLKHLKAGAGQRDDQAAPVAAWALDADHRVRGLPVDQPVDQLPVALRGVGDAQRIDQAAAFIDQRDGVSVLVNVDTDDQGGLLAGR
jgi:hypothetical protein